MISCITDSITNFAFKVEGFGRADLYFSDIDSAEAPVSELFFCRRLLLNGADESVRTGPAKKMSKFSYILYIAPGLFFGLLL